MARSIFVSICFLAVSELSFAQNANQQDVQPPERERPLFAVVDLDIGEMGVVDVPGSGKTAIKLLDVQEKRDSIRDAVRSARVAIEVAGTPHVLASGNYELPQKIQANGRTLVQVDCPITSGYNSNGSPESWGLVKRARLRVWGANSPWMPEGTFGYPIKQRWFATMTQMSNEPTYVDGGEPASRKKIYYHSGLDIGGSEGQAVIVAATDAIVASVGTIVLDEFKKNTPVEPRYDVVYLKDARGWFYRYSHLHTIDSSIVPGRLIKRGDRIGLLGKEGGSGGWTHLHFEIKARQPSGHWGTQEGYAFIWEAYLRQYSPALIAVARPHFLLRTGESIELDGSRSWSAKGDPLTFSWKFSDGHLSNSSRVTRTYDRPGSFSEILEVRDSAGRVSYDFAVVQVHDSSRPEVTPPTIHAAFHPTTGIKAGDPVTFKVRSFGIRSPEETWDFGDGTPAVKVNSDGNAKTHDPNGYATTVHSFARPGDYTVRVQRTSEGYPAITHLHVVVDPDK